MVLVSWEDKGVHTFPKGICPKVNVIARLEYELAYYDSAVHRFNTTRTPPPPQPVYIEALIHSTKILFNPDLMQGQKFLWDTFFSKFVIVHWHFSAIWVVIPSVHLHCVSLDKGKVTWRRISPLQVTYDRLHYFFCSRGINPRWNVSRFVKDLNSSSSVHSLCW